MDKLRYDNLYKFLVSLGIMLIVLPVAAFIYLFAMEPILISQVDFNLLSEFSLQMIANRDELISCFIVIFPWLAGVLVCAGAGLIFCGIRNWIGVQKNLDRKLNDETTIQTLNLLKMSNKEVTEKIEEEANEMAVMDPHEWTNQSTDSAYLNGMNKYVEIEERCFNYFTKKYAKRYTFERNIRMGRFCYDFIGVSQHDTIDLVVEVKYFRVAAGNAKRLFDAFDRLYDAGVNYEMIAHRNFRCIAVVATPKEQLLRLETFVETYCKARGESAGRIEIKCMAEEAL